MASPRRSRFRKWGLRILIAMTSLAIVAGAGAWYVIGPYANRLISAKLREIVSGHLNARLEMGDIEYEYPYGVVVNGASLVATPSDGPPVTLASFRQFRLQLRELPYKRGPLQIERIDVDAPTLRLIRTPDGFVGRRELLKSEEQKKREGAPKLSEVFHLRHLQLSNAKAQYEDQRPGAGAPPMVWQNLDILLDSRPVGASHVYHFSGSSGDLATIESTGTFDLDSLLLTLNGLTIESHVSPEQSAAALPPEVQGILRRFGVAGKARVEASGQLPLRDRASADFKVSMSIENARAVYPGLPDALEDVDLKAHVIYRPGEVGAQLDYLTARSGSVALSVRPIEAQYNIEKAQWTASPLRLAAAYIPIESTRAILDQPATLSVTADLRQIGAVDEASATLDGTTLLLPNLNEELKLSGRVIVRRDKASIESATLAGLGGQSDFNGSFDRQSLVSGFQLKLTNLSLASLKVLFEPKTEKEVKGTLNGEISLSMRGADAGTLTGDGRLRLTDGRFAKVPVLSNITKFIGVGEGLFVAERVFARFRIEQRKVLLERLAISSKALRVRGEGEIGFDKKLDLKVYVTGTGDWGKSVRQTGIPVISDIAGALAGGTQSVIRGVTSQFTSLKVTGTTDNPQITPNPAPIITDPIKRLFSTEE